MSKPITMKRTTSGLLQGDQKDMTAEVVLDAVAWADNTVKDPAARQALRIDKMIKLTAPLRAKCKCCGK